MIMPTFDSRYWNLSQAAAWVVYRDWKLVEEFLEQSTDRWRGLLIHPEVHEYEPEGKLDELVHKLTLEKLTAWGFRKEVKGELEAIPSREWADLRISPPKVTRSHPKLGQIEPWTGLRFESSDLKKLWRGKLEVERRTRFRWDVLESMWHEIEKRCPDFSKNVKMEELVLEYEEKYGDGSAPARTTIQNRIKRW